MVSCVVWDWNGTLLNDVDAAMQAMDRMLAARGLPLLGGVERYRELFTFPVREYYEAAGLDLDREPFEELAVEWTGLNRQTSRECGLFPGAEQVLEALGREGAVQLVVSASPQETLERQVAEQGIGGSFQALLGLSDIYAGSKAGLAGNYFQETGIDPARTVFVGDTLHDWEVAKEAGCGCVLLEQGHQSRRLLEQAGVPVLESIRQVPRFLKDL